MKELSLNILDITENSVKAKASLTEILIDETDDKLVLTIKDIVTGEVVLADAMGIAPMVCGFIVAAVSGYLAIRFMVDVIKKGKLKWFSVYVFILGIILLLDQFVLHMIVK